MVGLMSKEYTYYQFLDELCDHGEYDNYRMGPDGLEYQVEEYGELVWLPSGFSNMEDLLTEVRSYGDTTARYWEVRVD
jgi:hypothetical protein